MRGIPEAIHQRVQTLLQQQVSSSIIIKDFSFIAGGCINNGGKLSTSEGRYFLKWNDASKFPGMFEAEAKGLKKLSATQSIYIPEVIGVSEAEGYQFLLLEFIDQSSRSANYWKDLGQQLATLHRTSSLFFGLDHSNYIGSLPQTNATNSSWVDFFIHQRLQVQLKLAMQSGLAEKSLLRNFDALYIKLPSLLPEEPPSLLHGDLWSGNVITSHNEAPCLIDPAVYFGHREMDLAMTQLFGGFNAEFLEAYHEEFPLLPEFHNRIDLYNLYPLLVHVNLFGSSYLAQVNSILKRFV
ncbi:fructosamine kinase family protein [Ohtaekwangia koreensis]|uniref:Fructosamine-3-kinase n=1 Tax=Ohtaekwangia koreensis TaxID=688867 RepID=A0A1T5LJF0_9BACT|nr:fructosamine kinase family protein [Ohtaekwangia koreensis]SKC75935.1 Fructosamine-3-kinase [Ohtaekwangia koreensis]